MKKDNGKMEAALLAAAVALAGQAPLAAPAKAFELGVQAPKFLTGVTLVKTNPCFNSASIKPPDENRVLRTKQKKHLKHPKNPPK